MKMARKRNTAEQIIAKRIVRIEAVFAGNRGKFKLSSDSGGDPRDFCRVNVDSSFANPNGGARWKCRAECTDVSKDVAVEAEVFCLMP